MRGLPRGVVRGGGGAPILPGGLDRDKAKGRTAGAGPRFPPLDAAPPALHLAHPIALRSGSVTLSRFRSAPPKASGAELKKLVLKGLRAHRFEPLDPAKGDEDRSAGFVELEDAEATGFDGPVLQGDLALFAWRVDTLKVPGAEVKAAVARWSAAFAAEQGRPPARREKATAAEGFKQALRSKVAPSSRVHDVAWNLATGELQLWTGSRKVIEEIAEALTAAFGLKPEPLTPGARAAETGLAEGRLKPTPALCGLFAGGEEADHGEA